MSNEFKLRKYDGNPIFSPNPENPWESFSVCNPAAWYDDGKFLMLYRAAGNDAEHRIHFGLAESCDGFNFRRVSNEPVLSPSLDGADAGCIEDPRLVKFGEWYYVTYAYRPLPPGRYWLNPDSLADMPKTPADAPRFYRENMTQSGLLMSKDLRKFHRLGRITHPSDDNRDVILFPEKVKGRYALLHRSKMQIGEKYGCRYPSIWIAFSDDLLCWDEGTLLMSARYDWERKIGGASPPLKTDEGWLLFYHGVDGKGVYRVGAALLDLDNPVRILARSPLPLMEPTEPYERKGLYGECVFPTGNVVVDGRLYLYYGTADQHCCVATCEVKELLDYMKKHLEVQNEPV